MNQSLPHSIHAIHGRAGPSYIIDGETVVVVDVGFPSYAKAILSFVRNTLGRNIKDIRLVVLTHSHIDHIGGIDYLITRTGADLAAHKMAKKYLTGHESISISKRQELMRFLDFLRRHNFPRPSFTDVFLMTWAGIPGIKKGIHSEVTHWLDDGDNLPDHPEWKVIHTPGHTDDSICLYDSKRRSLITGDTIINLEGQIMLNPLLVTDHEALLESFKKLQRLWVDEIYPGWGAPVFQTNVMLQVDISSSILQGLVESNHL